MGRRWRVALNTGPAIPEAMLYEGDEPLLAIDLGDVRQIRDACDAFLRASTEATPNPEGEGE